MLSIYGISCDSASCLRNDRMCGKRVSFMFTRSVFTLCYWKCLSYKDCVKGLHDNVLFTFSKKYTGQSRLYKHQEKHWLLLIPNSNLSLCWSSRYLFTWFTFTPVFMRMWSHMFALICVSVSATLCKAINAIIALIWTCLLHVFMILFKEGSTLSVQFILNRLLHNM